VPEKQYRPEGRYMTAKDLADRLMPDLNINEALLWSPDLFAYTSYILAKTAAYQLVVSPPSNKTWQPKAHEIKKWLFNNAEANIKEWYKSIKREWDKGRKPYDFSKCDDELERWRTGNWKELWKTFWEERKEFGKEVSEESRTNEFHEVSDWEALIRVAGLQWRDKLEECEEKDFIKIDDSKPPYKKRKNANYDMKNHKKEREKELLEILLTNTPPLLLACWAFFYKEINNDKFANHCPLQITDLLCNQDDVQESEGYCKSLWRVSQAVLTMHAISDVASEGFGLKADAEKNPALEFAEKLLFGRLKYDPDVHVGGSLSTFNIERCRVLPKRHNPGIGITLRSLSSNLAFHQSAVDVVWRKTLNNTLGGKFLRVNKKEEKEKSGSDKKNFSLLLLPFPLTVRAKDFIEDCPAQTDVVQMSDKYGFFTYEPFPDHAAGKLHKDQLAEVTEVIKLIDEANKELSDSSVDMILFPEASLSLRQYEWMQSILEKKFELETKKAPSIIIAGVRESRKELARTIQERAIIQKRKRKNYEEQDFNFPRNAVYCQYFDTTTGKYYNKPNKHSVTTPKYKQYKHHRWRLEESQIRRYGLSSVFEPKERIWWESIKIPRRRVSFLNVGDQITISHLICEDLARQDPIAELVRHVGPSLVVAILLDGPQLRNRWSSRYATVLSDDPGCSVITLTPLGMIKRHQTEFGMMSNVIALWNDNNVGHSREIELAQGAEAVLLTLTIDEELEKTADGREEMTATSVIHLNDVIQIYPEK
jgi:hypothetical protein